MQMRREVDVFVPSQSLALEYNGEYHYTFVPLYQRELIIPLEKSNRLHCNRCDFSNGMIRSL